MVLDEYAGVREQVTAGSSVFRVVFVIPAPYVLVYLAFSGVGTVLKGWTKHSCILQ